MITSGRRSRLPAGAVAVSLAAGLCSFLSQATRMPHVDVTQEVYAQILDGMTEAEVVALLGPAGDYSTGPYSRPEIHTWTVGPFWPGAKPHAQTWSDDHGEITIIFVQKCDEQPVVCFVDYNSHEPVQISCGERILWCVKRCIRL